MTSEHPKRYIGLHYRSKRRTVNLALALGGRSTGWGRPGKPRRWFIGHHRHWAYHRGIELIWANRWAPGGERTLFAYEWGASPAPRRP